VTNITVGIIDYGVGNHASVINSLRALGFRVKVSDNIEVLNNTDVLLLPGVGAFPSAMEELHKRNLVNYLQEQAQRQKPILGICLGMQLLASTSNELKYTAGLDLIPGEIVALASPKWHIGWNTLECSASDPLLQLNDGKAFYFNHSFGYLGPDEYQVCSVRYPQPIACVIRRGSVLGVQFHPEKSQSAGREFLKDIITGLSYA
jgi:imidazole glycerol-phosphate synthase subunit HisH